MSSRLVSADEARGLLEGVSFVSRRMNGAADLSAAAPDLAGTVIALSEERDRLRAERDRLRATQPAEPPPGFVRVRVAVAVGAAGEWAAMGFCDLETDADRVDRLEAEGATEPDDRISFITVDVPMPGTAAEIGGEVSDG